jgi:hypothetical protein
MMRRKPTSADELAAQRNQVKLLIGGHRAEILQAQLSQFICASRVFHWTSFNQRLDISCDKLAVALTYTTM